MHVIYIFAAFYIQETIVLMNIATIKCLRNKIEKQCIIA